MCVFLFVYIIFVGEKNGDEQEENEIKSLLLLLLQMKAAWKFKKKENKASEKDGEIGERDWEWKI